MSFVVATTSLPAVNRPNVDRWNAARSCQYATKMDATSGLIFGIQSKFKLKENHYTLGPYVLHFKRSFYMQAQSLNCAF